MSEQIREQVSAFLDGELPNSETELLLKRLTRDPELRESFGRFALIGEACRGAAHEHLTRGLTARVNRAIDGEPLPANGSYRVRPPRWWRPFAGAAVAAGVAAVAVVALQQRASAPTLHAAAPAIARNIAAGQNQEPRVPYTVPVSVGEAPAALPAARLTNYVFAHSKYSSALGQSNVLSALLTDADEQQPAAPTQGTRTAP
jgi:sigma-E factor negative regulatory protein RseA